MDLELAVALALRGHLAAQRALQQALQRLSERDREVLVLRHHMQLTVAEVATEFGISQEAVKSRSHRAAGRLRALLEPSTHDTKEVRR